MSFESDLDKFIDKYTEDVMFCHSLQDLLTEELDRKRDLILKSLEDLNLEDEVWQKVYNLILCVMEK